jgi:AcrR family transcriptional regulator
MAERQAIIDAFLRLLAERGWRGFALRDVAEQTGAGLAELYAEFPSRLSLLATFMAGIDRDVLAGTTPSLDPDETVRDRLFDAMMRRYDVLRPHREAIAALTDGMARDPVAALALSSALLRSMTAVLEAAGVSADGWRGALRQKGLAAIHLAVLRVWLDDDSPDLAKTMAALDRRLKRAERWVQTLDRVGKSATRRRSADRPQQDPDASFSPG